MSEVYLCQQALKRVEIIRTESMDSQDGALLSSSGTGHSCLSAEVGPRCMPQLSSLNDALKTPSPPKWKSSTIDSFVDERMAR